MVEAFGHVFLRMDSVDCMIFSLLGKMSTRNKNKRLISELTSHSKLITNTNNLGMRMDYFGPLKRHLLYPLLRESNVYDDVTVLIV